MEEFNQEPIKVYIKVNENNEIVEVKSSIFLEDAANWIEIDEGYGDKFAHAQSQYFEHPLKNENSEFAYKYEDSMAIKN